MKAKRNYYAEIDEAIKSYEEYKSWHDKSIDWICNRIDWCWKFRHITHDQMSELADRIIAIMDNQQSTAQIISAPYLKGEHNDR